MWTALTVVIHAATCHVALCFPHSAFKLCTLCAGHANVQTDIKEAIFMGSHDELVAAGSDDGSVFIYDAVTGQVVNILQADEDVANCVQVS